MRSTTRLAVLLTLVAGLMVSCSTAPSTPGGRDVLVQQATTAMSEMNREDPGLDELTKKGYGYALFPEIAKDYFLSRDGKSERHEAIVSNSSSNA